MTAGDKHAHHRGAVRLIRTDGVGFADHSPEQHGATAFWDDGTTSYVLHTRSGHVHGWTVADEANTVIQIMDVMIGGEDIPPEQMSASLRDIRRLKTRLEAIENEAILYARESDSSGADCARPRKPRLNVTQIADELGLDHSTVVERHRRMLDGRHAVRRRWLVQGTDRAAMYTGSDLD
jgi:hypothetical protein